MTSALFYDRLQFAVTATFHYLFPQLTIGLAALIFYLKSRAYWTRSVHYDEAAHFWTKIFALSFAFGVVTGIPLEFQSGMNWAKFSTFAGGVIGQTLAMEGVFAFFLESTFLGVLLFGRKKFGPFVQWMTTLMLFLGSWLSGLFILATNAWMQHPVAYVVDQDGAVHVTSLWGLLTNPWLVWQFTHTMTAAVATGSFVMASVGAYYLLSGLHIDAAKSFLRTGVVTGAISTIVLLFPTGHHAALQVFDHQPIKGAAFEGHFYTESGADLVLIGQPNMDTLTIDNPLVAPKMLSFIIHKHFGAEIKGLSDFPREDWPDTMPLLYYTYHIMVGLGSMFIPLMLTAVVLLWRERLFQARWMLWTIMLMAPFPYIATTAGWMTAELGRQPWLVYGLFRTADGNSPLVGSGNVLFSLLGFLGLYVLLGLLFLFLFFEMVSRGPAVTGGPRSSSEPTG